MGSNKRSHGQRSTSLNSNFDRSRDADAIRLNIVPTNHPGLFDAKPRQREEPARQPAAAAMRRIQLREQRGELRLIRQMDFFRCDGPATKRRRVRHHDAQHADQRVVTRRGVVRHRFDERGDV